MYKMPKKKKNNNAQSLIISIISKIVVFILAVVLAGFIVLKVYLMTLPPIKDLATLKPNMVTQIYSADGEVIKTFTAFSASFVVISP